MKTYILISLLACSLFVTSGVSAQTTDLDTARANNSITELPNGFIKANNDRMKAFADEINKKRKQAYEDIAKKNGLTVEQVGQQAAKKIQEKMK